MGLLAPGAVIAGYRIESVVGRGGMGVVYCACELELERVVALKVIAPELLEDAGVRARFLREARTAASIEHPNVIPVHAAGERDGVAYLAMRFIDGDDLRTLIRRYGPLPAARAANVIARVASGLDAIHRAGYVHRDVKPANVLVDREGHVYVTDFGLAKEVLSRGGGTRTGTWVGTLDYVAPEQIRGGRVDARADVYALGGVLCFVLTGRVPFEHDADEAKLWAQLSEPPPVPSRLHADVPLALDPVVARAMAKAPEDRFPSAGDLGRAARAAVAGDVPSQPERMVARGAAAPGGAPLELGLGLPDEEETVSAGKPPATRPRARRGLLLALAAAAVVAAGAGAIALLPRDEPSKPATPAIRVVDTIRNVGDRPNGVAIAGGDAWVTSSHESRLDRIDGATGHELREHPSVGLGAAGIVSDGTSVWVVAKRARRLVRIDARSGRVVRSVDTGGPPSHLAIGLGALWVATSAKGGRGVLVRYDPTGRELSRTTLPHPVGALAAGAGAVWIAVRRAPTVLRFDPKTERAKPWGQLPGPATVLYYGAGYVWATLGGDDLISRVRTDRPGDTPVTTAAGDSPHQMVAAGGRLFIASNTDHSVRIFNPRTVREQGGPLTVSHNPYAVAADDRSVWVTGISEDTLTRIAYR